MVHGFWISVYTASEAISTSVIPKDHQKILEARWARVQSGETELMDWDDIKETIGRP
jgi:hypothetical protein